MTKYGWPSAQKALEVGALDVATRALALEDRLRLRTSGLNEVRLVARALAKAKALDLLAECGPFAPEPSACSFRGRAMPQLARVGACMRALTV